MARIKNGYITLPATAFVAVVVPYCTIADVGDTLPRLLSLGKSILVHGSNALRREIVREEESENDRTDIMIHTYT